MSVSHLLLCSIFFALATNLQFAECGMFDGLFNGIMKKNATSETSTSTNNGFSSIPLFKQIKDVNQLSADVMHGDYVGASLDGIDFFKTFGHLNRIVKILLDVSEKFLKMIHPIYWKIFPKTRNNGTFSDNLSYTVSHGTGLFTSLLKLTQKFNRK